MEEGYGEKTMEEICVETLGARVATGQIDKSPASYGLKELLCGSLGYIVFII